MNAPDPDPLAALASTFRGRIDRSPASRAAAGRDGSHLRGDPAAVVAPADPDDIVRLVAWARAGRVPLVARGGGSSLDGESVPPDGAVVIDFSGWRGVTELSVDERWARVRPGTVNGDLQAAMRPHGLFFPPNPGSWDQSTIGGNVATNASGPRSFRYGATRAWVRALEAVLGTGERLRLGSRALKRSVGPDLLGLVIGSEGTLGLITEVTVRLAPLPAVRRGAVVPWPPAVPLGVVVGRIARAPIDGLSAVEYVDPASAAALTAVGRPIGPGDRGWLLVEIEAPTDSEADRRLADLAGALRAGGVSASPIPFADADELWALRGESSRALDRQVGERIREDVAVPLPALDGLLAELARIAADERVPLFVFGHFGEGSVHPNFAVDPATPAAHRIRARTLAAALAAGGTISGEHGIGRLKMPFVADELGPAAVDWLRAVKRHCDPDGVLNPGKLVPPP